VTPERKAEIRERLAKATPGPWQIWDGPAYVGGGKDLCVGAGKTWLANMDERTCQNYPHHVGCHDDGCKMEADANICSLDEGITEEQQATAQLIAHAPTDIADLLTEVERLERELALERNQPQPTPPVRKEPFSEGVWGGSSLHRHREERYDAGER
jgi:hypothetical protein